MPFEVEQIYFMEEPLRFRYGLFLFFYGRECLWFCPHGGQCRTFDILLIC